MRKTRGCGAVVLVLAQGLVLAGCAGGGPSGEAGRSTPSSSPSDPASEAPGESPSESPSGSPVEPPAIPAEDPPPCADVRAGIDAFNAGEPEETVRLFRGAVPAAERYAEDRPSRTADLLLDAVRYYAELPADEYAAAILGSAEFKRHQLVTLAVCRYGASGPGASPTDDAVPA